MRFPRINQYACGYHIKGTANVNITQQAETVLPYSVSPAVFYQPLKNFSLVQTKEFEQYILGNTLYYNDVYNQMTIRSNIPQRIDCELLPNITLSLLFLIRNRKMICLYGLRFNGTLRYKRTMKFDAFPDIEFIGYHDALFVPQISLGIVDNTTYMRAGQAQSSSIQFEFYPSPLPNSSLTYYDFKLSNTWEIVSPNMIGNHPVTADSTWTLSGLRFFINNYFRVMAADSNDTDWYETIEVDDVEDFTIPAVDDYPYRHKAYEVTSIAYANQRQIRPYNSGSYYYNQYSIGLAATLNGDIKTSPYSDCLFVSTDHDNSDTSIVFYSYSENKNRYVKVADEFTADIQLLANNGYYDIVYDTGQTTTVHATSADFPVTVLNMGGTQIGYAYGETFLGDDGNLYMKWDTSKPFKDYSNVLNPVDAYFVSTDVIPEIVLRNIKGSHTAFGLIQHDVTGIVFNGNQQANVRYVLDNNKVTATLLGLDGNEYFIDCIEAEYLQTGSTTYFYEGVKDFGFDEGFDEEFPDFENGSDDFEIELNNNIKVTLTIEPRY
jgi:hypothetical protein